MSSPAQVSLDRMVSAVEKVRQRLLRAAAALRAAGIDYAVTGGNAVAAWVSTIDEAAVENPDVSESRDAGAFRILDLEALVRTKLTAFRDKDRTHLRDLIDVGLVDASWPAKFSTELAARLQRLLDTPEG